MDKCHRAMISWIPAEEGGRHSTPSGPTYSGYRRDSKKTKNGLTMSGVQALNFERRFANPRIALATVQFLVPERAPNHLLHGGSRFELMEGPKRVAKGVILPATIEVPQEVNEFESSLIG